MSFKKARWAFVAAAAFALVGCAAMTAGLKVNTPYNWDGETGDYAMHAKDGQFDAPFDKVFFAAVDMLEAKGFTVKTRDKNSGLVETEVWTEMGLSSFQLAADIRDMSGKTQVKWKLYTILPSERSAFTGVETGPQRKDDDDPAFKKKTNERWNYQLYMQLTGKTPAPVAK
jgi:hypothetical protein